MPKQNLGYRSDQRSYKDVTPAWAVPYVTAESCSVIGDTNGGYAVLDHNLQTIVAEADTQYGCYSFLHEVLSTAYCIGCGIKRMWDGGGYWCPPCDTECRMDEIQ